jgi:hypothetical protein
MQVIIESVRGALRNLKCNETFRFATIHIERVKRCTFVSWLSPLASTSGGGDFLHPAPVAVIVLLT